MKKKNRSKARECAKKEDKNTLRGHYEKKDSVEIPEPDFNSSMVYLNIYDLDAVSKVVNTVARSMGAGAFHAGVEVYGYEYSFGYIVDGETGVTKTSARYHPYHVYRESIPMVFYILLQGKEHFKTHTLDIHTYDILSRNCLNYADYFCNLLDVGSIPEWVMSLQKKVTWVKSNINVAASKLKELNKAAGIPTVINFIKKKYNENGGDYQG
ncbi:PPPDE peptidase [Plasmodium gonderi]|uniref:PPPDE peptidase n=1 Tax=Plasmodium gonderi TaxID=77519 RepID=A0A1Y1JI63_PLAGO|nr:PPPDE peptidase [Plasmodium gonderi]GAW80492.1 PPPDE peptidase [Plasmodium gonderi]